MERAEPLSLLPDALLQAGQGLVLPFGLFASAKLSKLTSVMSPGERQEL